MCHQAEKSIATMTHSDSPAWFCPRPCNRGSMCTYLDGSRRRSLFHPWDDCQWQRRDKFETVLLRVRPFCSRQFPDTRKASFKPNLICCRLLTDPSPSSCPYFIPPTRNVQHSLILFQIFSFLVSNMGALQMISMIIHQQPALD